MSENFWKILMWICLFANIYGAIMGSLLSLIFAIAMAWLIWKY